MRICWDDLLLSQTELLTAAHSQNHLGEFRIDFVNVLLHSYMVGHMFNDDVGFKGMTCNYGGSAEQGCNNEAGRTEQARSATLNHLQWLFE